MHPDSQLPDFDVSIPTPMPRPALQYEVASLRPVDPSPPKPLVAKELPASPSIVVRSQDIGRLVKGLAELSEL